jgi:pantoate--beta-alanine ligase
VEVVGELAAWRELAERARHADRRVGLVPTMGALHDGHASLIARAAAECDEVIVSIFVNPRQFDDPSDLARYPRPLEADLDVCERHGASVVATPTLAEMWPSYPEATATTVHVTGVANGFEGADRAGHFDGVASVVAKLFHVTGRCRAYFGKKDFQQLAVVRTMVTDLEFPVEVVGCEIVRDERGLALSSRNVQLSPAGRERALGLSRAVFSVQDGTERSADGVRAQLARVLSEHDLDVAYAEVVDPVSLRALGASDAGPARVLLAARVEGVRLLDNGAVTVQPSRED